jgi:hypothetical protein
VARALQHAGNAHHGCLKASVRLQGACWLGTYNGHGGWVHTYCPALHAEVTDVWYWVSCRTQPWQPDCTVC